MGTPSIRDIFKLSNWMPELRSPFALRRDGIVGINERNIRYVSRYNARRLFPLVDNKLKTKLIAEEAGIVTPKLIGSITNQHDVANIHQLVEGRRGFCVKPAKGSGGKGILVITDRDDAHYVKSSGQVISAGNLERHATNILAGLHSLGGSPDVAIVEELIEVDPMFTPFSVEGVPDIRVIVCRGFPVMAMMRLSTHASDGKANLHQGAVGVGFDLATGRVLNAVQYEKTLTHHPDTGQDLKALEIPGWDHLLVMASSCYDVTRLGYLGIDLVVDKRYGPMLLELNARPGLSIQVANGCGLRHRLQRLDHLSSKELAYTATERVACSQAWFSQ